MMFTSSISRSALQGVALVAFLAFGQSAAFRPSATTPAAKAAAVATESNYDDRRALLSQAAAAASLMVGAGSAGIFAAPQPAQASGGATAGGAYLLSAKQRYNDRVTKGVKGYLNLEASLKAGSVEEAKAYFAGDAVGTFGDISTAGYLLANAFRRSANQAPDSLPSVKVSYATFLNWFGLV